MIISAVLFLVAATPICLFAAWSDLKDMIIPNWVALALVAAFCLLGVMFLPFEDVLWRLLAGFLVLVAGFVLNALGLIGGGDVKFLSGLVPFVATADIAPFLMIMSASMLVTLAAHRIAARIPAIRRATPDWESWRAGRKFPMGISIAVAGIVYLALRVFVQT